MQSEQLKRLHYRLAILSATDTSWVKNRLKEIEDLDAAADADIETLESIYYPRLDNYHALREVTHAVITNNRARLAASLRELDNVSDKLEYEISALRSKVEDVEDFVEEFKRQVNHVCERVEELEKTLGKREGWWHWVFRKATGIGSPPQ